MTVVFTKAPFEDNYDLELWPTWHARYLSVYTAIKMGNPIINEIIKHAPYVGGRTDVLIDVRMQHLMPGYVPTSTEWHIDTPNDPESIHHIYVLGMCRTQFEVDEQVKTLPHGYYATYSSNDWHRAHEVEEEEYRLFVRIQESNLPGLENKLGLFTYYPNVCYVDGTVIYEDEDVFYNKLKEKLPILNRGRGWKPNVG